MMQGKISQLMKITEGNNKEIEELKNMIRKGKKI